MNAETSNGTWTRWRVAVALAVLWAVLYLPVLGQQELRGEEARRVLPALAMIDSGNWVVPHIGGEPYYNKPPLINWCIALAIQVCGNRSEMVCRLTSVFASLALVMVLAFLPGEWPSARGRLLAGICYLTNVSMIDKGRQIEIEAFFMALTGIALLWWLAAARSRLNPWWIWLPSGAALGAGLLLKGPLILWFFYAPVLLVTWTTRRWRLLFSVPHLLAVLLAGGLFVGWAQLAAAQASATAMQAAWQGEIATRFTLIAESLRTIPVNLLRALLNFMPWIVFLPLLWRRCWVESLTDEDQRLFRGLRLGLVITFLAVCLIPMTRPRYSLPVFPLACLLLGWALDSFSSPKVVERWCRNILLVSGSLIAAATLGGAVLTYKLWWQIPMGLAPVGLAIWAWRHQHRFTGVVPLSLAGAGLTAIALWGYLAVLLPINADKRSPFRKAAALIDERLAANATLSAFRPGFWPSFYYIRHPVRYVLRPEDFGKDSQVVLLREADLPVLVQDAAWRQRQPELLLEVPTRGYDPLRLFQLGPVVPEAGSDSNR